MGCSALRLSLRRRRRYVDYTVSLVVLHSLFVVVVVVSFDILNVSFLVLFAYFFRFVYY